MDRPPWWPMNIRADRWNHWKGFTRIARLIAVGIAIAASLAVLKPGYRLVTLVGGAFGTIPGVGDQTYEVCFDRHVAISEVSIENPLAMGHVLPRLFNQVSRRIAELRGASACPPGTNIEKAWTGIRDAVAQKRF